MNRRQPTCFATLIVLFALTNSALSQTVLDPGFESYSVSAGEWTNVDGGPWQFNNNAGVVEPFAPPTVLSPLMTWAATIAPYDGQQYASAYAGSDFFDTIVDFPMPGDYFLSVYAASPPDSSDVNDAVPTLTTGAFRFALGGAVTGPTFVPPLDAEWNRYSTTVRVNSAGPRLVGFHTTKTAPYFVYFDAFSLGRIPEPATLGLALIALIAPARWHRRRLLHLV
jgi:hypothetical protein